MWNLQKIEVKNLLSFQELKFDFEKKFNISNVLMIYGKNETDKDEANSNGSGKSGLLESIFLGITGEVSRGVDKTEFINDEADFCEVNLEMYNDVTKEKMVIYRHFKKKGGNKVKIFLNNQEQKELSSITERNKFIYKKIGIEKDDLLLFFMIGQDNFNSFLTANDAIKKRIISRLIDVDFIDEKIKELKEQIKELDNVFSINESKKDDINFRIEELKVEIADVDEKIKKEKENDFELQRLKTQLKRSETELKKLVDELHGLEKDLNEILVDEIENKIEKLQKQITEKDIQSRNLSYKRVELVSELRGLRKDLNNKVTCPKCNHTFIKDHTKSVDEVEKEVEKLQLQIKKIEELKGQLDLEIVKKTDLLNEFLEVTETTDDLVNEINILKGRIKAKKNEVKMRKEMLDTFQNEKENKILIFKKLKEKLKSKIKKLNENFFKLADENNSILKEIEKKTFWVNNLGKKGFKTFLINKSIQKIEDVTNFFLSELKSNMRIKINGYTALKSGELREKIDVKVVRYGEILGNIKKYSGGEKTRINLANILGLNFLINSYSEKGGLNLLILDEVFDVGLDDLGQLKLIGLLETIDLNTMIVSHKTIPIGAKNEIIVKKIYKKSFIDG